MILYRLAIQRLIDYFQLNQPSKEQLHRMTLMHTKPKERYKTKLKTDKTLNLYISILLSVISIMTCMTVPFAALDDPSRILRQRGMTTLYKIAKFMEGYTGVLDFLIVVLIITLIYVTTTMILDAVRNTKIDISPWIEMGKYSLPPKNKTLLNAPMVNIRHSNYL